MQGSLKDLFLFTQKTVVLKLRSEGGCGSLLAQLLTNTCSRAASITSPKSTVIDLDSIRFS